MPNEIYDVMKVRERIASVIRQLRNFASTECASAEDLLRRDDLLQRAILPVLAVYDGEYKTLWDDYVAAGNKAFDLQNQLNQLRFETENIPKKRR